MNKELRTNLKSVHLLAWLTTVILSSSLFAFTGDKPDSKRSDNESLKRKYHHVNPKHTSPHFDSDPIRFTLRTDNRQVALGAEVTFTITAHYLNISPALLFLAEGSTAFRLKLLVPDGFIQTGGNYSDYVGTELSTAKTTVSYTLKGYFTKAQNSYEFRLLRGSGNADETSLFVEKARLSISVNDHVDKNKNGRLSSNCDYAEGQFLLNWYGEQIYAHYYNGVLFASYQDPSQGFKPQSWLQATGFDTNKVGCFATNDPHTSSPNNPNPPVDPPAGNCTVNSPNASFDFADCNGIGGWALDQTNLNQPVLIDIYVDGIKTYAGITANGDRQDLVQYFGANGRYHGFSYSFPADAPWKNGQNHSISVRICGVNNEIGGSPKTVSGCTGGTTTSITPTTNPPTTNCGTGSGLTGFYSNSTDLSQNLIAVRNDAQINFTWDGSPIPGVVNTDGFSIRWFGQVEAPVSGNYTFKTNNDDGTRLWVNGQLLINDWNGHGPIWQQGSVYLNGGQKYDIVIDYFDYWGGAQAQLYWEYPGQGLQLVPGCRLYPLPSSEQNDSRIGNVREYRLDNLFIRTDLSTKLYTSNLRFWPWPKNPTRCPNLSPKIPRTPKPKSGDADDNDDCGGQGSGSPFGPVPTYDPVPNDPSSPSDPKGGGPNTGSTDTPTISGTRVPTTARLDEIDCDKISGWAFANAGGYAYLDIYAPDPYSIGTDRLIKVATIKANNAYRPDVRAVYGNEAIPLDCGFVWAIPDGYKKGRSITIKVVPANDVTSISNSPKTTSGDCNNPNDPVGTTGPPVFSLPSVEQVARFYTRMSNAGINFSDEERAVIAEYNLYDRISAYVNQYGQKPDGSNTFILSAADQQKYPRFTEIVNGMPAFVEQHDRVKQALIQHTHLPWNKIKVLLKPGLGPKIIVNELNNLYGHTVYPAYPEPFIEINAKYVRGLESANLSGTREATAFLLAVTLLHELTHYGAVDGGRNESRNNEFGDDFEREILGTVISKDNAGKLLVDFIKKN